MRNLWVWILILAVFGCMFWYLNRDRMGWGPESAYCLAHPPEAPKDPESLTRSDSLKMRYNVGDRLGRLLNGCE
jgi:hypothetical protein